MEGQVVFGVKGVGAGEYIANASVNRSWCISTKGVATEELRKETDSALLLNFDGKPDIPAVTLDSFMEGKCPKDGRENKLIFISVNGNRVIAVSDGEGHAYATYGEGTAVYSSVFKPENRYNPDDYEYIRHLTGHDF